MKCPEEKNKNLLDQLKDAVKKPYEKPEKVSEEEHVASKSACGRCGGCGALVKKF